MFTKITISLLTIAALAACQAKNPKIPDAPAAEQPNDGKPKTEPNPAQPGKPGEPTDTQKPSVLGAWESETEGDLVIDHLAIKIEADKVTYTKICKTVPDTDGKSKATKVEASVKAVVTETTLVIAEEAHKFEILTFENEETYSCKVDIEKMNATLEIKDDELIAIEGEKETSLGLRTK